MLSKTFTLSAGADLQALRAIVRNNTTSGACASGQYADRDDLVFRLGDMPPQVTLHSPGAVLSGTVSLSAEASDDTVSGTVTLQASAQDGTGVVRVEFLQSGNLLGVATQEPFQIAWDTTGTPDGTRYLSVRAQGVPVTIQN